MWPQTIAGIAVRKPQQAMLTIPRIRDHRQSWESAWLWGARLGAAGFSQSSSSLTVGAD
jgi:hypothetical protein